MLKWAKYLRIGEISFLNRLAYLGDHLSGSLFLLLVLFVFSQLWKTALADGEIAGFDMVQMLWYMVFTEVILLSNPSIHRTISDEVKNGEIAYKLARPYSYPLYYYWLHLGEFAVRFLTNLAVGGAFAYLVMGPLGLSLSYAPLWLLGIVLAVSLNFLMVFTLALISFWVEDNSPFFWVHSKVMFIFGGLFVPVEAYPPALRSISYLLPFRYGLSAPARLMVDFRWDMFGQMMVGGLIWVILLSLLVRLLFTKGVARVNVHGG